MKTFDKITRVIYRAIEVILAVSLAVMLVALFAQVILRYFFSYNIFWSDELARYLHVWLTMLGAAILARDGSHVRLTLVEEFFPKASRRLLFAIRELVILAFAVLLFYFGLKNMNTASMSVSVAMQISMSYMYVAFPATMVLTAIMTVFRFLAIILNYTPTEMNKGGDLSE